MAQDIHAAIVGLHPKIPVIGGAPSIDNLHYLNTAIATVEGTRLFVATMAQRNIAHDSSLALSLGIATTPVYRLVQTERCVRYKS